MKSLVGLCLFPALIGGCAAPGQQATLPNGRWAGDGVFVYEQWKADEPARHEVVHRSYPTTLSIRPGELNGHQVVFLEIESDRGSLANPGDKTSLKAALLEASRASPTIVLYRLVGIAMNPKADEALAYNEQAPPCAASCITDAGVTVLQINYGTGFTDVFRFHDRGLYKAGSCYDEEHRLIHWTERLTRRD